MLEGLLIDLVPYGRRFEQMEHTWHNGPGIVFWAMGGRWLVTRAGLEAWHRERAEERERGDPHVIFGMQTKDGTPIGLFGINRLAAHHRLAMLTALIGEPEYWGGGYGTDALLLTVDYAFDWLDMHKVWLMTMSLNPRVMRQMEKTGFTLEARLRDVAYVDGVWADGLIYGMLCDEWPGRAALIERLCLTAHKES